MKRDRINELLSRYLQGQCSADEWAELLLWIDGIKEEDIESLSPVLEQLWEKARQQELPSSAHLADTEKIHAAILQDEGDRQRSAYIDHMPHKKWSGYRVAAAAAIFGFLILSSILIVKKGSRRAAFASHAQTRPAPVVLPGSNKAILTLSNGRQIVLDSSGQDTIGRQGSSLVVNEGQGRLLYKADTAAQKPDEEAYNTISTPRGGQFEIRLPDGTRVWLNALSSLRYPVTFPHSTRPVEMTGEAYFEVAKDPSRPFEIKAAHSHIVVLGTAFNVNAYADETVLKTSVIDGIVKVNTPDKTKILVAGQESLLSPDGNLTAGPGDVALAAAWKNGYFQFDKASVPAVMRQIGRWYDLDVQYSGPVPDRLFKGKLQRSLPLSAVLRLLQQGGIHLILEGKVLKVAE